MSDWQPIETAPKDGTHIWLFCPDDEPQMVVGYWLDPGAGEDGIWCFADEALEDIAPAGMNPTHWMPLPEPPA